MRAVRSLPDREKTASRTFDEVCTKAATDTALLLMHGTSE